MRKNQKGFTLVELLVVVVIIALLVAVSVPLYNQAQQRAREAAFNANVRTLKGAATMFMLDYPMTEAIWAPFAGQEAEPREGLAVHDRWQLYLESWPEDSTRPGSTFVVEISRSGRITVSPDVPGE